MEQSQVSSPGATGLLAGAEVPTAACAAGGLLGALLQSTVLHSSSELVVPES